ncbi:unnamed protein product [Porites lobata]|uniref:Uncharacterized protein n=1 Tax=Porites lobata TaxID=104759 RepID=A0ABN8QAV7_9CNID|nr:unnamed protein product [Porites lobata]
MAAVQKSFCGRIIKMKSIDIEENIYGQDESQCFGNGQYRHVNKTDGQNLTRFSMSSEKSSCITLSLPFCTQSIPIIITHYSFFYLSIRIFQMMVNDATRVMSVQ